MFQVKICGITNVDDARAAMRAGADAIGLNFYSGSPRCISREQATVIAHSVRDQVQVVGVFVNATVDEMLETWKLVGLNGLQLHGDESPEIVAELGSRLPAELEPRCAPVIRAFRCSDPQLRVVADFLQLCQRLNALPSAVLLDTYRPGQWGGTGQPFPWEIVPRNRELLGNIPVILAGGLTPLNVGEAIRTARPEAVDTASGVEISPGRKDPRQMAEFVANAHAAFEV